MEPPPPKRIKVGQAPYDDDDDDDEENDDELSLTASQFEARQDPLYELDKGRAKAAFKLKSRFEDIFAKYGRDFDGIGDEVDLHTGEIVVNNGHIQSLQDEQEREAQLEAEEEERILQGKPSPSASLVRGTSTYRLQRQHRLSRFAVSPQFMGAPDPFAFGSPLFGNGPIDPAWQTPEIRIPAMQSQFGARSYSMPGGYGSPSGFQGRGSGFLHQPLRKIISAREVAPKGLPAPSMTTEEEEEEGDEEIDEDALLGLSTEDDAHDTQDAPENSTRSKSPTPSKEAAIIPISASKTVTTLPHRVGRWRKNSSDKSARLSRKITTTSAAVVPLTEPVTAVRSTGEDATGGDTPSQTKPSKASVEEDGDTETPKHPVTDTSPSNDETAQPQGRRSSRTRRQTEFYGQVNWVKIKKKRQRSDASTTRLSEPEIVPAHSDKLAPKRSSETAESDPLDEEIHSGERDPNPTLESNIDEVVSEAQEYQGQHVGKELLLQCNPDAIALGTDKSIADNVETSVQNETVGHSESQEEAEDAIFADCQDPTTILTDQQDTESHDVVIAPAPEVFVRNQLDPSYLFSDDEDDYQSRGNRDVSKANKLEIRNSLTPDTAVAAVLSDLSHAGEREEVAEVQEQARESAEPEIPKTLGQAADISKRPSELSFAKIVIKLPTNRHLAVAEAEAEAEAVAYVEVDVQSRAPTPEPQLHGDQHVSPPASPDQRPTETTTVRPTSPVPVEELPSPSLSAVSAEEPPSPTLSAKLTFKPPYTRQPQTPSRRREKAHQITHLTSSHKKSALASLIPDNSDDEDEISILSHTPTSSFRSRLFDRTASRSGGSGSSSTSTPRKRRKHSLLVSGTPIRRQAHRGWPATEIKPSSRWLSSVAPLAYSSPLARTALENVMKTPQKRKPDRMMGSPTETLYRTPGGTVRRCGEDGFVCDRDFCFTCCK